MHILGIDFISGFCLGLEFFFGDQLEEDEKFAFNINLGILRIYYVLVDSDDFDDGKLIRT